MTYVIQQDISELECPFCSCRPCITDERNRQNWWINVQQNAHALNTGQRKGLYKRFWLCYIIVECGKMIGIWRGKDKP